MNDLAFNRSAFLIFLFAQSSPAKLPWKMMPSCCSSDGVGSTIPHGYKPAALYLTQHLFGTDKWGDGKCCTIATSSWAPPPTWVAWTPIWRTTTWWSAWYAVFRRCQITLFWTWMSSAGLRAHYVVKCWWMNIWGNKGRWRWRLVDGDFSNKRRSCRSTYSRNLEYTS